MGMENLVSDKRFIDILNNYSQEEELGNVFSNMIGNRKSNDIIIPILGLQGMGKSTLINSILSENILPNDADETTCVPVEVKYGEEEKALVYFRYSHKVIEAFTREDLNKYVDNLYNPGNEKKVSHIVLYRTLEILKNGVTIVDLPGVGSLTKENQETTMRYIKNLCTAIFVIPTIPTIRRSEEIFIKSIWMQFSSAIFVQNNFGETKREVEESVEFNSKVLKNIGESIKTSFNGEIIVVNAYDALWGKLNNDMEMVKKSNIDSLTNKINSLVSNWSENEEKNIKNRAKLIIDVSKKQIQKHIEDCLLSEEELRIKHEKEEEGFKANTKKFEKQIEEIEEFLDDKEDEIIAFARKQSKICTENIRSDIFRLIDNGVVDGEMLTDAFNNFQHQHISEVLNNYCDIKDSIVTEFLEKIEELDDLIKLESEMYISALNFNNGQAFKFEKGLEVGIDVAGGFGAVVVGMKVGGVIGSTFGGPIGTAVGGLAGLAVGVASSIFGSKTKKAITDSRGRETKRQIELIIDEIGNTIKKEIIYGFKGISSEINETLEEYISNRKKELSEIKAKNIEKTNEDVKSNFNLENLEADYKYLTGREKEING